MVLLPNNLQIDDFELSTEVHIVFRWHTLLPTPLTVGNRGNMSLLKLPITCLPYLLMGSRVTLPRDTLGRRGPTPVKVLCAEMKTLGPINYT